MHACVCFFCQHSVGIKSMWKITMQICDIDMVSFYYCIASQYVIDMSNILIVSCSLFYIITGLFWQSPSATLQMSSPCPCRCHPPVPADVIPLSLQMSSPCPSKHRLVVKASALRAEDPGFESRAGIFSGWSHTNDFKIGTPVATLPGAWCYRVSAGTGWPGVSIL